MWKPQSDKHSSNAPISHNVNFEPTFLEESRLYLFCLLLCCPYFSLNRNKKALQSSAMSPVTQCINILAITITFFQKSLEFGRHFAISYYYFFIFLWPFLALLIVQLEEGDRKQSKKGGVTCSKGTRAGSRTQVRHRALAHGSCMLPTKLRGAVQLAKLFRYQSVHLFKPS